MGISWLKSGAASQELAKKAAQEAEVKKQSQGKTFRFWLEKGEENVSITFVDGELSEDGFLLPSRLFEHNLYLNNRWGNYFVCPEKTDENGGHKCPLCASGDEPYLVALFTVIDHRANPGKKDPTKIFVNQPRLLVAKPQTFELLNKIALKRGGLAGATFDVARVGDKSAAVGTMFDFTSKEEDLDVLRAKYQRTYKNEAGKDVTETVFKPLDYEKELEFRTGEELAVLFGSKPASTGSKTDYSGQL